MRGIDCLPFKFSVGSRWFSQVLLCFLSDGARDWSHQFPETARGIEISDEVLYVGSLKGPFLLTRASRKGLCRFRAQKGNSGLD